MERDPDKWVVPLDVLVACIIGKLQIEAGYS